jgi:hypothetical protein
MVKQTSTNTARNFDKPITPRSDHASASQSQQSFRNSSDDIIMSLANAYENKRARQVTEWERVQTTRWQRAA